MEDQREQVTREQRAEERVNTILLRVLGLSLFQDLYYEYPEKMDQLNKEIQGDLLYIAGSGIEPKSLIYPCGKDESEKEGAFGDILTIKEVKHG